MVPREIYKFIIFFNTGMKQGIPESTHLGYVTLVLILDPKNWPRTIVLKQGLFKCMLLCNFTIIQCIYHIEETTNI